MKKILLLLTLSFSLISLQAQDNLSALMPMPNQISNGPGVFKVSSALKVYTNATDLSMEQQQLTRIMKQFFGTSVASGNSSSTLHLLIDKSIKGNEHYVLKITPHQLVIKGASSAAVFYGLMTLEQLLTGDVCHTKKQEIQAVTIDDMPRFGFRALMIDPARNFLPLNDVKYYIDEIARYKYNTLQIHLTDNEGWRVEIKKYPQLTAKAPFYTQEELKELIAYAAQRHVEILPELDIPGHTVALLASFPELACKQWRDSTFIPGVTNHRMVCASRPEVYDVYANILKEVASIFPSPSIHLGGDEAALDNNWQNCDDCKALMKEKGYEKPAQLMGYFFDKILQTVRQVGKKPILWVELDSVYPPFHSYLFKYPKDVTLVTWRLQNTPTCLDYTYKSGNPIIMAPGEYAYLDYPQLKGDLPEFNNWGMPVLTLEQCYQFDPGYGLPKAEQAHILGVMGTLWGEAMKNINRVTYMTFPRALALSEAGWTQMEHRSWNSFKQRLYPNLNVLMQRGVFVRAPYEIVDRKNFH